MICGGLVSFAMVCDGLVSFGMVCGGLSFSHTIYLLVLNVKTYFLYFSSPELTYDGRMAASNSAISRRL